MQECFSEHSRMGMNEMRQRNGKMKYDKETEEGKEKEQVWKEVILHATRCSDLEAIGWVNRPRGRYAPKDG